MQTASRQGLAYYLGVFAAVFFGMSLMMMATNIIVNPAGIYDVFTRDGFNRIKSKLGDYSVPWKLSYLERKKPPVVFLGNSRTEVGINPASSTAKSLIGHDVDSFNAAIPASTMYGIRRYMQHVAAVGAGRQAVVIGIDYILFRKPNQDASRQAYARYEPLFAVAANGDPQPWHRLALLPQTLVSLDVFSASWHTLTNQKEIEDGLTPVGYASNHQLDMRILEKKSPRNSFFREEASWIAAAKKMRRTANGYEFSDGMHDLEEVIEIARANNIRLLLYITPVHANLQYLEGEAGEPQAHLAEWKTAVTSVVAKSNTANPRQLPIELWDFSIVNDMLAEPVPASDHDRLMQWYLDPSHYRESLGDKVMQVLFTGEPLQTPAGEQFGYRLTPETVDGVNALHQAKLLQWQAQSPEQYLALQKRIAALD